MVASATDAPRMGMLKGFYNKHSSTQASAVNNCKPLLVQAAEQAPIDSTRALYIAEWGCAHGGNSIAPVYTISEVVSNRFELLDGEDQKLQLHVTHTDVVQNSWSELFQCAKQYQQQVQGNLPNLQVTYAGIGSSQYERNDPNSSLDLGFSFNALHWLSKWPCHLKHTMSPFSGKALPEELSALTAQATEDLTTFLTLRADEFRRGGHLVLNYGTFEHSSMKCLDIFSGPHAVTEGMVAEGLLREDELGSLAAPVFFLDEATQRKVFDSVSDMWELLHYDVAMAQNPQVEQMMQSSMDRAACGQIVANFMKAAVQPFMEAGLKKAGRDQASVDALLDTFFTRLAEYVAAHPTNAAYPTARVLLRRRM